LSDKKECLMSFDLVTKPKSRNIFRHLLRKIVQLIGVIMVIIGLASSSLPLLFLFVLGVSIVSPSSDFPGLDAEQAKIFFIATVIAAVGIGMGLKLIRGRRRLVLLLRRFGFDEATKTLSYAAASAMGQRWRLVTLDDNEIAPVLGLEAQGRAYSVMRWIFIVAIAFGLVWLLGDGLTDYLKGIAGDAGSGSNGGGFKEKVGEIISQFIVMLIVTVVVVGIVVLLLGFLSAGLLFTWRSHRSYKKAASGQTREIVRQTDISSVIADVLEQSKKILSPRLVVVRVNSDFWQEVVKDFIEVSAVIIIDVSSTGEGLLWELDALKEHSNKNVILVGEFEALDGMLRQNEDRLTKQDLQQRLLQVLDGQTILAYRSETPKEMERFAKLLRARLNSMY
jgi:hypothetical protein